ncbi:MAG: hypothetical protein JWN15_2740, partial [Firmicutes bacterium]|nr:hypothetical protein [Bacillota bacterium]
DPMKLQTELLQDAVVSVGGQEVIDGVTAVRLDVDLSKVKFGPLFAQLAASMPVAPDGGKPGFTVNIDRYLAQYWINPETQFVHKVTIDMALSMVTGDPVEGLHTKVAMKGELRGTPVSEPINFPDFSAPGFTAEQKLAAQTYWDGLTTNVPMEPCATAAKEADAHWQDSAFAAGQTAAVKAAACFTQHGQALAALKPPADFAEAHKALSLALTASATAYTGYGEAFALAARGDTATSAAIKAEAATEAVAADKTLMQAVMQLMQAAARYGFK